MTASNDDTLSFELTEVYDIPAFPDKPEPASLLSSVAVGSGLSGRLS